MQWLGLVITLILTVPIAVESARDVWSSHFESQADSPTGDAQLAAH